MEPTLRSTQVLKQEAEELGYEGKEVLDYVKEHQKLDREERAAWRNNRMADIEKEKKADEIKIKMTQIEVDKGLKLKEMEFQAQGQAQANTSAATTPAPRNAKMPSVQSCHPL